MKARRQVRKLVRGEPIAERHEQWVGLAFVLRHGLPGYPRAVPADPYEKPTYPAPRKTSRRVGQLEWGEVA
jgi:hypothetical protein